MLMGISAWLKPTNDKIANTLKLTGLNVGVIILAEIARSLVTTNAAIINFLLLLPSATSGLFIFGVQTHAFLAVAMVVLQLLLAYLFACYASKNGHWIITALLFLLVSTLVMPIGTLLGVGLYNDNNGHACKINADCISGCGGGSYNRQYISTERAFGRMGVGCVAPGTPVCIDNRCETARPS
jgi:hypothetical protein